MFQKILFFISILFAMMIVPASAIEADYEKPKRSEAYFMTRAERATRVTCSGKPPAEIGNCRKEQLDAARRIVAYIRQEDKERRLKRTLDCLQKIQFLPRRIRRSGMLWVERCATQPPKM